MVHDLMVGMLPTLGEIGKDKPAGIRGGLVHVQPELQNASPDLLTSGLVGPVFPVFFTPLGPVLGREEEAACLYCVLLWGLPKGPVV